MVRIAVLTLALLASVALGGPKPSRDCVKQCDEALKVMANQCRNPVKGGDHHDDHAKEDPNAVKKLTEACRDNVNKMKSICAKQCAEESSGRRR